MQNDIKHMPCKPISMRAAGLLLFNLNTQKVVANDAIYSNTNERKAA